MSEDDVESLVVGHVPFNEMVQLVGRTGPLSRATSGDDIFLGLLKEKSDIVEPGQSLANVGCPYWDDEWGCTHRGICRLKSPQWCVVNNIGKCFCKDCTFKEKAREEEQAEKPFSASRPDVQKLLDNVDWDRMRLLLHRDRVKKQAPMPRWLYNWYKVKGRGIEKHWKEKFGDRWVEATSGAPQVRKRRAHTSEGRVHLVESWRGLYHLITACGGYFRYSDSAGRRTCVLLDGSAAVTCSECLTTIGRRRPRS